MTVAKVSGNIGRHHTSRGFAALASLLLPATALAAPDAEEVNAASYLSGARQVNEEGGVEEDAWALIDGYAHSQWEPPAESLHPILIQLAEPFDLSRVEVVKSNNEKDYPGISVKELLIETGASPKGPWTKLARMTLSRGSAPQKGVGAAKGVRYLRVTAQSNFGNKEWYGLSELRAIGRRSQPRPPNFTGAWETKYGELVLKQEGLRITGCYGSEGSKSGDALVEGTLEGPVFAGTWMEFNEQSEVTSRGTMAFALTAERGLSGIWGQGGDVKDRNNRWDGTPKPKATITCEKPERTLASDLKSGRAVLRGILFDTGKDVIRAESTPVLQALAAAMKELADKRYIIEGHTDDRGGKEFNQGLSERRAQSVKAWLVKNGIAADRLRTVGYGFGRPTLPNDSEAGRAANRRVEVAVDG
ncbi:MAG: OmpA family protein [Myxococcales bacterium]|nr:OmpA family protein [Myxococcales bacterium]